MIIKYTPADGEPQTFDAGRLRASEIQIVERTADRRWAELKDAMGEGDVNAMRVAAWVVMKRTQPSLRFAEFDPWEDEIRALLDERETSAFAEKLYAKYGSDPAELAEAFDELRDAAADREACEQAIADVTAPKDPAPAEPEQQSETTTASLTES
ncbi:hypothetical protein [Streptomyces ossamyceticus]|uniref:hypothetical protein n=1 Tax=Streptomyces ossamyceticus TaxID=249581 RepID=UPI0006E2C63E|nr:hypothetical protein [Streptomyces ossamyceticus]